jgi:hypothetical protein
MKTRSAPGAEPDRAAAELLKHLGSLRCFNGWANKPLTGEQRRCLRTADRQQLLSIAASALLRASRGQS